MVVQRNVNEHSIVPMAAWARREGLELRFIAVVEDALRRVSDHPERWRILEDDVRICLAQVFPYAILYTVEPDYVLIIAVMHCHREHGYWQNRRPSY